MKLNLGAGYEDLGDEWMTVDLDPATNPTLCRDVRDLGHMPADSVDEIRAVDILEHLSYRDTVPALKEWARVLKPGGLIFIQVPAADVMMDDYTSGRYNYLLEGLPEAFAEEDVPMIVRLAWRLLGGHFDGQYTKDSALWYLNAHHAIFDHQSIMWAAKEAGLQIIKLSVNPHPNYQVWMRKP